MSNARRGKIIGEGMGMMNERGERIDAVEKLAGRAEGRGRGYRCRQPPRMWGGDTTTTMNTTMRGGKCPTRGLDHADQSRRA
jgi:hypothetical protein